jgi:hypothetical protein
VHVNLRLSCLPVCARYVQQNRNACFVSINLRLSCLPVCARYVQKNRNACSSAEQRHQRKVKRAKKRARETNLQKRVALMEEKGSSAVSTPSETD